MNLEHLKKQAKNLQRALSVELARDVALSSAQEWTARMHGYPDWHAATKAAERAAPTPLRAPAPAAAVTERLELDVAGLGVKLDKPTALELHAALRRYLSSGECERDVAAVRASLTDGIAAARRLLAIARGDTGQSRKVADFLLAWYNADENGGWNPFLLGAVDAAISADMLTVLAMVREHRVYPSSVPVGLAAEIAQIYRLWRDTTPT